MGRTYMNVDVMTAAIERIETLYAEGHRNIVSFSAGKDSGVLLELAIEAAARTDRLPVEVVMRDEEIMLPGTYEYADRMAAREEVDFHWIVAHQPIINAFDRKQPYWWVFDPTLDPDEWVRKPPAYSYEIPDLNIEKLITSERFPPPEGRDLIVHMGLRASESRNRMFGLYSGGYVTKVQPGGYRKSKPISDWSDGDIWKAIGDNGWDYNKAYDVLHRRGMSRRGLRIAPPTMRAASIDILQIAARAWPRWFDKVATRCPGVRSAAQFGKRAVEPIRKHGESWEDCYTRTCLIHAPGWIIERATRAKELALKRHRAHSTEPLPQAAQCPRCPVLFSWQQLTRCMYMGDPFAFAVKDLPYVEPDYFRPGSGTWGGKPTW